VELQETMAKRTDWGKMLSLDDQKRDSITKGQNEVSKESF